MWPSALFTCGPEAQCLADGVCSLTLHDEMPSAFFRRVRLTCVTIVSEEAAFLAVFQDDDEGEKGQDPESSVFAVFTPEMRGYSRPLKNKNHHCEVTLLSLPSSG